MKPEERRPDTFAEEIMKSAGNAPIRIRRMLLEEWQKVFPKRSFPDNVESTLVYLAIRYKKEMVRLTRTGKEVTDRFAENYNNAIHFKGFTNESLTSALKLKFKEGDINMAKKLINKKDVSKKSSTASKKNAATGEREYSKNSMRYIAMEAFSKGLSQEKVAAVVKAKTGKDYDATYYTCFRAFYNAGRAKHLGFPAPKKPIGWDGNPGSDADGRSRKTSVKKSVTKKTAKKTSPKKIKKIKKIKKVK